MDITDKKIDLVYLWVDGSDEKWAKSKAQMIAECTNTKLNSDSIASCRFQDNNELLYSLRSVEKNLSWINHIYIVTDNQKPKWLNLNCKKITIIDQKEIMDDYALPNFNSCAIETYLSKIPNLSEYFIYANDDMFFYNKTSPELFFDEEMKPIYQMGKKILNKPYNHLYGSTIVKAHKLVKDKYNKQIGYFPHHGADPYRKSYIDECIEAYKNEFVTTRNNHFRSFSDIQRVIYAYWAIAVKGCRFEIAPDESYAECRKSQLEKLSKSKFPLACINSGRKTKPEDIEIMTKILQKRFPKISSFENNKKVINVCCVADNHQAEKMQNSIISILENKNIDESINFWIIDSGIKKQNLKNIKSLENDYDCTINIVTLNIENEDEIINKEAHIKACCNVLFSDTIKSDKIIYVDNNIVIKQSLIDLYNSNFENNLILSPVNITSKGSFPSVKIVNCGVMLINLAKLKNINYKSNNNISDIITDDKIKYIKNNLKINSNKDNYISPFGLINPTHLKSFIKNIFSLKNK